MNNIIETPERLLPTLSPSPDSVFGDGNSTGSMREAEALWRLVTGQEVSYFALPVLAELARRPYHAARVQGPFDLAKLARDRQGKLFRSEVYHPRNDRPQIDRLLFHVEPAVLILYDVAELTVFAPTPQAAAELANELRPIANRRTRSLGSGSSVLGVGSPAPN